MVRGMSAVYPVDGSAAVPQGFGMALPGPMLPGLNPSFLTPHGAPGPGSWWADVAAAQPSLGKCLVISPGRTT